MSSQFLRFVVVGIVSNVVLYGLYVCATTWGIEHKLAMSGLFAIGVLQTFIFNKSWSFAHKGQSRKTIIRYLTAYFATYMINLSAMLIFVDRLGFPDAGVQAVMIVFVALFMFILQRYWVFRILSASS